MPLLLQVLGHYLRRQRSPTQFVREIRSIASRPALFFNVSDERALHGIVGALGDRIFSLEGQTGRRHGDRGTGGHRDTGTQPHRDMGLQGQHPIEIRPHWDTAL